MSESTYDYKYYKIYNEIDDIKVVHDTFFNLLKKMFMSPTTYYHIRYVKYRGIFLTFFRLFLIIVFAKISNTKIIWTCHNIYEHNIPYKNINKIIIKILSTISYKIVVFHKDLKSFLPKSSRNKIEIANFGDFSNYFNELNEINKDFRTEYEQWKKTEKIQNLDLIYISASTKNKLDEIIDKVKETDLKTLIIAPKIEINPNPNKYKNIFFFNSFVKKEVTEILKENNRAIGIVAHNNISVPTSIYMFASFKIPIIGLDFKPVNSIINENNIGLILKDDNLIDLVRTISANYQLFQSNLTSFLNENSWEKSINVHKKIFEI